jgi:hypothetical protein
MLQPTSEEFTRLLPSAYDGFLCITFIILRSKVQRGIDEDDLATQFTGEVLFFMICYAFVKESSLIATKFIREQNIT